jgi:hypothetical protein
MLHIQIPFGYKTIAIDRTHIIFTGKIRVRVHVNYCQEMLGHCPNLTLQESRNGCTTIKFSTTCSKTNDLLIKEINAMLCKIMHERIDAKYAPKYYFSKSSIDKITC